MSTSIEDFEIPTPTPERSAQFAKARYNKTGIPRWDGNPLIEALPTLPKLPSDFGRFVEHDPPIPTASTRRMSEVTRLMMVDTVKDLVYPFFKYEAAALALSKMLRNNYVSRNPLSREDTQRRHALATKGKDGLPFPRDWHSTASGVLLIAVSGMGKTTFKDGFLVHIPQLIKHRKYKRHALNLHQIVYITLNFPFDGTLRSLCLQFFRKIDRILGTSYRRQARALRSIAPMVDLMDQVATAVSLSFIVIDDFQNIQNSGREKTKQALDYICHLMEIGIGVVTIATPALQSAVRTRVRGTRKMSGRCVVLEPMTRHDGQWQTFCETLWKYTYTLHKQRLTKEVLDAWYKASGGNTAFATLAFILAQENAIAGTEIVDAESFKRVASTDMAMLQPAIAALLSKKNKRLQEFEDLLFGRKFQILQRLLGVEDEDSDDLDLDEDDEPANSSPEADVEPSGEADVAVATGSRRKQTLPKRKVLSPATAPTGEWDDRLPEEDPLVA